jgi:hypothetical protein
VGVDHDQARDQNPVGVITSIIGIPFNAVQVAGAAVSALATDEVSR